MWCPYAFKHSTESYYCCSERGIRCPLSDCTDEAEVKRCGERATLCGFLAPDGTFYHCQPYEHMELAERITRTVMKTPCDKGFYAERFLLMNSFVEFHARTVAFLSTGAFSNCDVADKRSVRLLTDEQIAFLEDALTFCIIEGKRTAIKSILEEDWLLKNDQEYRAQIEKRT